MPLAVACLMWGLCISTYMQGHLGTLPAPVRSSPTESLPKLYGASHYWSGLGCSCRKMEAWATQSQAQSQMVDLKSQWSQAVVPTTCSTSWSPQVKGGLKHFSHCP